MTIKIYSKPDCSSCRSTKFMLKDYDYEDINVMNDTEAFNYVKDKGVSQLPLVEITSDHDILKSWNGFNPLEITKLKRDYM